VVDNPRIDDLRRRVQRDPASIAFAQLAEECRRAGQYQESIDVCRAGLALHPGYLSARVTLGRALIEIDQLDEAQAELEVVLGGASENLAAIRGLAEIFHRRGALADALKQYRAALAIARNDPDLERTVTELSRAIEPKPPAPVFDGLSFEQMADEFMKNLPPPPPLVAATPVVETAPVVDVPPVVDVGPVVEAASGIEAAPAVEAAAGVQDAADVEATPLPEPSPAVASYEAPEASPSPDLDAASPAVWEQAAFQHTSADSPPPRAPEVATSEASPVDVWPMVSDGGSDTVSDPAAAADAPSGHNGTATDLTPVAVDTLISSLHAPSPETASTVDSIGQQADVPAVVLSESPLAAAADAAPTDEDAAPPVNGATRAHAQATIAALDQWLDAIHVACADRRA
jgi:Tetratricopeptide repeat